MVTMLPCQCPSTLGKFLHPQFYPCTCHRSFTEVWFRSDSPFSVAPSEQLGSQEELLRLHPLGQVGRSSCGQPSGRMLRRVEHLQGDTQSPTHGQQLNHIHIFGAGVRSDRWSVIDSLVKTPFKPNLALAAKISALFFSGSGPFWWKRSTGGADPRRGVPQETCPALGGQ